MGKPLTEKMKKQISDYYHNRNMSDGLIAETLGVSRDSVRRHRHYLDQDPSESMPVEKVMALSQDPVPQTSQTIESTEESIESNQKQIADETVESDVIDYEAETTPDNDDFSEKKPFEYVEVTKCPGCDTPKSEWTTIDQTGYKIPEGYEQFYDYVCPECKTLIPDKKFDIESECPTCGSDPIDWLPIEKANVREEIKRVSDFICLECWNPITISD